MALLKSFVGVANLVIMLLTKSQKISLLAIILLLCFSGYLFCLKWQKYKEKKTSHWEVTHVLDGDTVEVFSSHDHQKMRLRLACLDAPEKDQAKIGELSKNGLQNKIEQLQKMGANQFQIQKTGVDIYGRTLGLIFHESMNISLNEFMAQQGFVFVHYLEGEACLRLKVRLLSLEFLAKQKKKGVFKYCSESHLDKRNCAKPWNWRKLVKKEKGSNKKLKNGPKPGLNAVEIAPKGFLTLNKNF